MPHIEDVLLIALSQDGDRYVFGAENSPANADPATHEGEPHGVGAAPLEGNVLDEGRLYAVWLTFDGTGSVEFSLDGAVHRTEGLAPWDYDGTAGDGTANRVTFPAGSHTISAVVTPTAGDPFTVEATFEVE